jgi:hypothetical protein
VSVLLKKPERDIMIIFIDTIIAMAGRFEPAVYMELICLSGLSKEKNRDLCQHFKCIITSLVEIDLSRVYLRFTQVSEGESWRFIGDIPAGSPEKLHQGIESGRFLKEICRGT